jgi:site-specific recombinase XerD
MYELLERWESEAVGDGTLRLARQRFIALFGILTGVRLEEMASLRLGAFSRRVTQHGDQYWLSVLGKGQRQREIPLPDSAMDELARYLVERGLPALPQHCPPETPMVAANPRRWQGADPTQCLSTSRIGRIVKSLFQRVADCLDGNDKARFQQASTHWMRHTYGSRLVASGASVTVAQKNMGHADAKTTSVYLHEGYDERWQAVQNLDISVRNN